MSTQDPRAADMLMEAGQLHEEKTGDLKAAMAYFQEILERYPGHRRQADAAKHIRKIQEKRGG